MYGTSSWKMLSVNSRCTYILVNHYTSIKLLYSIVILGKIRPLILQEQKNVMKRIRQMRWQNNLYKLSKRNIAHSFEQLLSNLQLRIYMNNCSRNFFNMPNIHVPTTDRVIQVKEWLTWKLLLDQSKLQQTQLITTRAHTNKTRLL